MNVLASEIYFRSLFLGLLVLFSISIVFAESIFVEDDSYDPSAIGQEITYQENLVYLVLDESPEGFLRGNMGISRMLATDLQARGNDIHVKKSVPNGMKFKIVKMFKYVHTDLESWDPGARELYLDYSSRDPGIDYMFVLSDENGVQSTVMIANLMRSSYGKLH